MGDNFGRDLVLSGDGNTLAVSSYLEDSAATGIGGDQASEVLKDSGAVYVFVRTNDTWSQQAYVKASNPGLTDHFGYSLALSNDGGTLAVGALREDSAATGVDGDQADNSLIDAGAVHLFTRQNAVWSQQAYIKASNPGSKDWFGHKVALSSSGDTLAVGAYGEDSAATGVGGDQASDALLDAGAVYLFTRQNAAWSQRAYVKASNPEVSDMFGMSLALSADGTTLAVGTPSEDSAATGVGGDQASNAAPFAGAVYLY